MTWVVILIGVSFTIIGLGCIFLAAMGLPGTWIFLALAMVIEFCDRWYLGDGETTTFGWFILTVCIFLAALGEFLEFLAGVLGAKRGGSSKMGMWGALIGGIGGAIMGIGIPIPIVGSLMGALIGTFLGALVGELANDSRSDVRDAVAPATGATIGRLLGTLAKIPIAIAVWLALSISAFWM